MKKRNKYPKIYLIIVLIILLFFITLLYNFNLLYPMKDNILFPMSDQFNTNEESYNTFNFFDLNYKMNSKFNALYSKDEENSIGEQSYTWKKKSHNNEIQILDCYFNIKRIEINEVNADPKSFLDKHIENAFEYIPNEYSHWTFSDVNIAISKVINNNTWYYNSYYTHGYPPYNKFYIGYASQYNNYIYYIWFSSYDFRNIFENLNACDPVLKEFEESLFFY